MKVAKDDEVALWLVLGMLLAIALGVRCGTDKAGKPGSKLERPTSTSLPA